jgi:hypothetical protein
LYDRAAATARVKNPEPASKNLQSKINVRLIQTAAGVNKLS